MSPIRNVAVFFGEATEHVPPDGAQAAIDDDGANTLVWVHEGNRWVAASWTWARAGIQAERDRWNHGCPRARASITSRTRRSSTRSRARSRAPRSTSSMGQGRNAVFLATQGWKVTGVDISDAGLAIAREDAAKQNVKLDTVQSDIAKYDLGKDRWDLVTMIYAGDDLKLVERIKPAVKKGGLFVTEYFAADSDVAKSAGGWDPRRWRPRSRTAGRSCATITSRTCRTGCASARPSSCGSWRRSSERIARPSCHMRQRRCRTYDTHRDTYRST